MQRSGHFNIISLDKYYPMSRSIVRESGLGQHAEWTLRWSHLQCCVFLDTLFYTRPHLHHRYLLTPHSIIASHVSCFLNRESDNWGKYTQHEGTQTEFQYQ